MTRPDADAALRDLEQGILVALVGIVAVLTLLLCAVGSMPL
ncbi:hypothetical protein [Teichococcus aestuarii]